nr:MAG TPA: hypothetical protein [Caudoviricetes sp.]
MRHSLLYLVVKKCSHPRKREHTRHLSHGALCPIRVAGFTSV